MGTDPINTTHSYGSYGNGNGNGNGNSNVIRNRNGNGNGGGSNDLSLCLACKTDRLFLDSFGSAAGTEAFGALSEAETSGAWSALNRGRGDDPTWRRPGQQRGRPLVPQRVLPAAWRSGGVDHLAGYEQQEAHEFLQAFLGILGKHTQLMDRLAA